MMATTDSPMRCGDFELREPIGDGTTGQVWKGVHVDQGVPVAVKVLASTASEDWDKRRFVKQSFDQEITAAARLNHPGIVRVFEVGTVEGPVPERLREVIEVGAPYIAMEYTDKGALASRRKLSFWGDIRELL
ncbi:MAG: protein kinase, partial [Bradymonadaceae bacterium]